MESGITVDWDDQAVQRAIASAIRALSPSGARTLMRGVGLAMEARTKQKFAEERGPEGPWAPLKPATIARRRTRRDKPNKSTKILQDTGRMKGSIHSVADADSVDVGTPVNYSPFQQEGAPRAHIPPRPFLYVDSGDADRIEHFALKYLERSLV